MKATNIFDFTKSELEHHLNMVMFLLAEEMVKDGMIEDTTEITDRYLAMVFERGTVAKMFQKLFQKKDDKDQARMAVIRVHDQQDRTTTDTKETVT